MTISDTTRTSPDAGTDASLGDRVRHVTDGPWRATKERVRAQLVAEDVLTDPSMDIPTSRARVLEGMHRLAESGEPATGFRVEHGGAGDAGGSVTSFEMLAYADLSLMVKAGVQWGLFGGAIENLGTERHHRAYVKPLIDLDLLGCFAMTETGHGSNVQELETTATYDPDTEEFVVHTPTPSARKDYIGGAGVDARLAAVFARLITGGEDHGVHCLVVPIRDDAGADLPGVTTSDCGPKAGLAGVDNGRIVFDHVRVPRENLLNRYADVEADGTYSSSIENVGRRFFTMLGTLIRGRISVGGAGGAAARVGLSIAVRYALQRRQFGAPGEPEVLLMDYLVHQRRLLPLVARSYALQLAQNQLVGTMHEVQSSDDPDPHVQRELEGRAAGLKAANTWHATRAIQEAREACGGAGYLSENRLVTLKADTDVFTTFEGDNHVLTQLVAKELLTAYADEVGGLDPLGMIRFATRTVADVVVERTAAQSLIQRLVDASPLGDDLDLLSRGTQLRLFEDREKHVLETVARRLQRARGKEADEAFAIFNAAQDHLLKVGQVHVDRVVLEAFVAGIEDCEDPEVRALLGRVCDLYALSVLEADRAWFVEHKRLTVARAKELPGLVNRLCADLRPHALTLVEGMGVPGELLGAAMLDDA